MDLVYLLIAALLWAAVAGLAVGCSRLQSHGAEAMSAWDVLGGLLAVGLLIYLVAALLHPEDFS